MLSSQMLSYVYINTPFHYSRLIVLKKKGKKKTKKIKISGSDITTFPKKDIRILPSYVGSYNLEHDKHWIKFVKKML